MSATRGEMTIPHLYILFILLVVGREGLPKYVLGKAI